jgi:hypothetical protein
MKARIEDLERAFHIMREVAAIEMGTTKATTVAMWALLEILGAVPEIREKVHSRLETYYSSQLASGPIEEAVASFDHAKDLLQDYICIGEANDRGSQQDERWRRMEERISQLEEVNVKLLENRGQSSAVVSVGPCA